jgi:hypothetical protein
MSTNVWQSWTESPTYSTKNLSIGHRSACHCQVINERNIMGSSVCPSLLLIHKSTSIYFYFCCRKEDFGSGEGSCASYHSFIVFFKCHLPSVIVDCIGCRLFVFCSSGISVGAYCLLLIPDCWLIVGIVFSWTAGLLTNIFLHSTFCTSGLCLQQWSSLACQNRSFYYI